MRKKLLVILLLLVVLIVLVVTRCGGKKDQQNDPADGQGFAQQSGKAELPAELKLGVVTETESGSAAEESGWRISAMGFCPELARPLGVPTLILREAGRRGRVSGDS